jgi:NAD(P)-dependent dehydrogenase (short-subunit alcohol dehydrogenase family)
MDIVLITGGNKALGRETARRLSAVGWTVFLGARDRERGEAAARELSAKEADVRFVSRRSTTSSTRRRSRR